MKQNTSRKIVLVSGIPGAGKTTLAQQLATALGFALISNDHIKETLFDTIKGRANDLQFSRQIGGAAMELLWALAAKCPRVVIEANFRPKSQYERERIIALEGQVVEVNCKCSPEIVSRHFAQRSTTAIYYRARPLETLSQELLAGYDHAIEVGTVIEVDTSTSVDIEALVSRVQEVWRIE